ncbi:MAG: UTP--glucose-1-phosphate uridylyltransferase, partial [Propionibacterium sp.]
MKAAGVEKTAIRAFTGHYQALASGATGIICEDDILPVENLPKLDDITVSHDSASEALKKTAVIKLNGGLGTSMGLDKAKSLLPVRDNKTFLDIMLGQIMYDRQRFSARLPLLFMNSYRTRGDTEKYLEDKDNIRVDGLPMDFLQNSNPKIYVDDLSPAEWPESPELEWNPPGHGDFYPAIWGSGVLDQLLEAGFEYAFISNSDNLGATADEQIAGWFADSGASFAMEVCRRSVNDRKGGHLAIRKTDGRIILRESAQVTPDEMKFFADENLYTFFNTNSIW